MGEEEKFGPVPMPTAQVRMNKECTNPDCEKFHEQGWICKAVGQCELITPVVRYEPVKKETLYDRIIKGLKKSK
jgi:hypothetical protein